MASVIQLHDLKNIDHQWCSVPFVCRWHDIANMSHNKSFFALELANKEETIQFQTVSGFFFYFFHFLRSVNRKLVFQISVTSTKVSDEYAYFD